MPHIEDTIVAQASAVGAGARAILRLSGPGTNAILTRLFGTPPVGRRSSQTLRLFDSSAPLIVEVFVSRSPHSYTGQDTAELHFLSSPPLVAELLSRVLACGARLAQPGEFTMRAFLSGKRDLTRAEAVLGVIEAGDEAELRQALRQMAGGVGTPLAALREDLLNLLADVEAGLDFVDEDISFVGQADLLKRLGAGLAMLTLAHKQLAERTHTDRPFRVALIGYPNVGKSSLFNALSGESAALVSPIAGTTRDYVTRRLQWADQWIELADTAGWELATSSIAEQSQILGADAAQLADVVLLCVPAGRQPDERERAWQSRPGVLLVVTKCDKCCQEEPLLEGWLVSAVTGRGVAELRAEIVRRAAEREPALAPSHARCRHHISSALKHLRQAHSSVLFDDPPEILAAELRLALDEVGALVGTVYTDDLLDRIFTRFCIGK